MAEDKKQSAEGGKKDNEEKKDDEEGDKKKGSGAAEVAKLASPEGLLMLSMAGFFAGIGLIPIIGTFSSIVAGIFFSVWMIATGRKGWLKLILALVLEAIPIVGDIVPFVSLIAMLYGYKLPVSWIGFVWSVL